MIRRVAVLLALPLVVAGCSSGSKKASEATKTSAPAATTVAARTIDVKLTDDGCEPRNIAATSGPTTFKVTAEGTGVSEFEVHDGSKLLGEVEHVTKDNDRSFSVTLQPGSFQTLCPGGAKFSKGTLEVAGAATGASANAGQRKAAVDAYLTYVKGEADVLISATTPFVDAVKAG